MHYCISLPFTPWAVYYALFQVLQLQDLISKASHRLSGSGLERAINPEVKKAELFLLLIRCSAINLDLHGLDSGLVHVEVGQTAASLYATTAGHKPSYKQWTRLRMSLRSDCNQLELLVCIARYEATAACNPPPSHCRASQRDCGFKKSNWQRQALCAPALIFHNLRSHTSLMW